MADELAELMDILLDELLPLDQERGFEGAGEYAVCPFCGQAFRVPDVLVRELGPRPEFMVRIIRPGMAGFEKALGDHLETHDRMEIYRVVARLIEEGRKGRTFRRRVEGVLGGWASGVAARSRT